MTAATDFPYMDAGDRNFSDKHLRTPLLPRGLPGTAGRGPDPMMLFREAFLHQTEKTVAEHGSRLIDADRRSIENAMADLREALKGNNAPTIISKTATLEQASAKIGEAIYSRQQGEAQRAGDRSTTDENVVDAEFTEIDDDGPHKKSA
ncbi:hypothetical protein [Bradyrhizobium sp. WU425]|uniref:hypothetical protein n=1 Tax=Bradyrhizobium sp. WU425 TaxID=187029 RepID=UPI001E3F1802|nr:hypothetical protein [Bradyrhizobium canariense]UFW72950.1 hypothetical protein BcanWU425_04040 [Bradyrhizobium canariense]